MSTATIEEVQTRLMELLDRVATGEDVVIYQNGVPVATLTAELPKGVPIIGRGHGKLIYMAPDFDEPLDDFKEYM